MAVYGIARTNYVTLNAKVVEEWAAKWGINFTHGKTGATREMVAFFPNNYSEDGGFPTFDSEENELDWMDLAQHLPDGEVLIVAGSGHDKMRYVFGYSSAYSNKGLEAEVDISQTLHNLLTAKGITGFTPAEY